MIWVTFRPSTSLLIQAEPSLFTATAETRAQSARECSGMDLPSRSAGRTFQFTPSR